jgi:hypothetical protein
MAEETYSEEYIQELTERVFLLREKLEEGTIKFAPHLVESFKKSFLAIRLRDDGLVDPSTVDGRIRAATAAIRAMVYRKETKESVSLVELQECYFNILFGYFGDIYRMMIKANATPYAVSEVLINDDELVNSISEALPDFFEIVQKFWDDCSDAGTFHLQDSNKLKASFSGDLFPSCYENSISIAGLYVDTIILPCPVLKIQPLAAHFPDKEIVQLLLKHVLTAMTYKEFAVTDIQPPLVAIQPPQADINIEYRRNIFNKSTPSFLKHAHYLFDRKFESSDELKEFCSYLDTIEIAMKHIKRPDRILFDTAWPMDPRTQLETILAKGREPLPGLKNTAGNQMLGACLGRFPQALGIRDAAQDYGGTPYIHAETSWKYYNWMLEYDSKNKKQDYDNTNMHIVRALSSEMDDNLAWLGNIPPKTILKIRLNGQAEEIRDLLSSGISELVNNSPNNYHKTADKVVNNLDVAFRKHQKMILSAKKEKLRFYGIDVGSCIVTGTIAVAAAYTSSATLGTISAGLGLLGTPNLKDIKSKFKEMRASERKYKSSPTGLLFNHI